MPAATHNGEGKVEAAAEKAADKTTSAVKTTGRAVNNSWIKWKISVQYLTDWNTVLDDSDIDVDVNDDVGETQRHRKIHEPRPRPWRPQSRPTA